MSEVGNFIAYVGQSIEAQEGLTRSEEYFHFHNQRRSVRDFSDRDVPFEIIQNVIKTAGTAPSGAHKQPWTFCLIRSSDLKKKIRTAAEQEEFESYNKRMSDKWLKDLAPLGTDWNKPFLEIAPWIIVIFKRAYEVIDGEKWQNYYVNESVGIASGMLISAIHNAGLVTLTHTPSPMNFLTNILERPANERPFLLLPVGYAADDAKVPDLNRKSFEEICIQYR